MQQSVRHSTQLTVGKQGCSYVPVLTQQDLL
jgi:hypothetical protein